MEFWECYYGGIEKKTYSDFHSSFNENKNWFAWLFVSLFFIPVDTKSVFFGKTTLRYYIPLKFSLNSNQSATGVCVNFTSKIRSNSPKSRAKIMELSKKF